MKEGLNTIEALAELLVDADDSLLAQLVELRKSNGLTQLEVAARMGVSQPTVAAFERYDANPRLSTIRRYALAVGAEITHTVTDGNERDVAPVKFDSSVELDSSSRKRLAQTPFRYEWRFQPARRSEAFKSWRPFGVSEVGPGRVFVRRVEIEVAYRNGMMERNPDAVVALESVPAREQILA